MSDTKPLTRTTESVLVGSASRPGMKEEDVDVWVEDLSWHVPSWYDKCRSRQCPNAPVADLSRKWGHGFKRYAYCADHLYGRRIVDGKVLFGVRPDSPAAKRGWI